MHIGLDSETRQRLCHEIPLQDIGPIIWYAYGRGVYRDGLCARLATS